MTVHPIILQPQNHHSGTIPIIGDTEGEHRSSVSADIVRRIIHLRKARSRFVPVDILGEPGWDILLDLLHAEILGLKVSISSLCIAAGVPATTALRRITSMVSQGLLMREPDLKDARRIYIRLEPSLSGRLHRYFREIIQSDNLWETA